MKRIISILLAVMLVASCAIVASAYSWDAPDAITVDQAVAAYEAETGEDVATYRYYFLMPNGHNGDLGDDESVDEEGNPIGRPGQYAQSWYIPMADGTPSTATAGVYWWDSGVADPAAWIGYLPSGKEECDPDVYYADVPQAVTGFIWNNAVDGGMDPEDPIYFCAAQTNNIPCEYYDPEESPNYPDGTENFNNMIYVIDPDLTSVAEYSGKQTCGGEWYYYYGNGCYGFTADGNESNCLRDDHFNEAGEHVGLQTPSEKPSESEPPTEEPSTPDFVIGDADQDGVVSVMDATEIQLYAASKKQLSDIALLAADADGDGVVTVMDATEIQLFKAGKIPSIPRA